MLIEELEGELNSRGCLVMCCEAVKNAVIPFRVSRYRTRQSVFAEYQDKVEFLVRGKIAKMVCDLMERDWDKMRNSMLDKLEKEYKIALNRARI